MRIETSDLRKIAVNKGYNSARDLSKATAENPLCKEVSEQSVGKYYNNKVSRYDSDKVIAFCVVLGIQPGDFIKFIPNEK